MSDELEPGYLLVLVIRHTHERWEGITALVQCLESGNNLRIKRAEVFICRRGEAAAEVNER